MPSASPTWQRACPRLERLEPREVPATLLSGFPTVSADDNEATTGARVNPPDTHGAAGPNHLVEVVNTTLAWYLKDGTRQSIQDLNTFLAPAGSQGNVFDPKVVYDSYAGRFVVAVLDSDTTTYSSILVAVSKTSDPNAGWNFQRIDSLLTLGGNTYWTDYPGLAYDDAAVYVTGNAIPTGAGGPQNAHLWIMDKGLYSGGASG